MAHLIHHRRSASQTVQSSPKVQFNLLHTGNFSASSSSLNSPQSPSPPRSPRSNSISSNSPSVSAVQSTEQLLSDTILHRFCPWCGNEFKFGDVFCSFCGNRRSSYKTLSSGTKPRWKKILWEKQPYEDNYVDETFLNALVKNANFSGYTLHDAIRGSTLVSQQISTVTLFVVLFLYTLNGTLSVPFLISLDIILVVFGFIIRIFTDVTFDAHSFFRSMKTLVILLGSVFSLSPVLRTLTNSFSDDTISACTVILLILHLFFHDYGYVNGDTNEFHAPVSLNAAIFAGVLLASRLPSNLHVFALISIAIEMFALFPILRHHVKKYSQDYHDGLTISMVLLVFALFAPISITVAVLYAGTIIFITIGSPLWLLFIQQYKNAINGPWDEAKIKI